MKRYDSIGELLVDYRDVFNISQTAFADKLNVDIRTVQRWERGETLVKADKEEEIVVETFLPYQLIRNLNSAIAIPTYYDFRIRKYSLNEMFTDMPDASWFKKEFKINHDNVRLIDYDFDKNYLIKFIEFQKDIPKNILLAIQKSIKILPELNVVVTDDSGYYSGHSIFFPIKIETYEKLLNREMKEEELCERDIINSRTQESYVFYNYDITADNNFNIYYLADNMLKFFNKLSDIDYIYCSYVTRHDTFEINDQLGFELMWEEEPMTGKNGMEIFPRFYKGDFKGFLKKITS